MLRVNNLTGFGSGRSSGGIQFVGYTTAGKNGATSGNTTIALNSGLTGGIASSASNDDLVIAVFSTISGTDRTLAITDGTNNYTLIGSELFAAGIVGTNLRVARKFVNGDTSTTFGPSGGLGESAVTGVFVFRGVDLSTPLDVTVTTATKANSLLANPPSITPVTQGALVFAVGAGSTSEYTTRNYSSSDLTGFTSKSHKEAYQNMVGAGYIANWTSGAVNPAQFTYSGDDSSFYSCCSMSIALRPA